MHFGFSYVGTLYLLLLMVPNLIWAKNQPEGYGRYAVKEDKILLLMERAGEVLVSGTVLVFSDFNLKPWSPWTLWLLVSISLMVLYEVFWVRYFRSRKTMMDFYSSLLGIPVAGATLPVAAFFLLAVYGLNPILGVSTVVLGIGHIGIHLGHRKEALEDADGKVR